MKREKISFEINKKDSRDEKRKVFGEIFAKIEKRVKFVVGAALNHGCKCERWQKAIDEAKDEVRKC